MRRGNAHLLTFGAIPTVLVHSSAVPLRRQAFLTALVQLVDEDLEELASEAIAVFPLPVGSNEVERSTARTGPWGRQRRKARIRVCGEALERATGSAQSGDVRYTAFTGLTASALDGKFWNCYR